MYRSNVYAFREVLTAPLGGFRALLADTRGHDLTEYALMAGFITVTAAAIMPTLAENIDLILSRIRHLFLTLGGGSAKPGI